MEAAGSARLTDEIPAERAVTAIVSREEIVDAVQDEGATAELRLEVAQRGAGGHEERSTIGITWARDDLEKLLAQATSETVVLTFDRNELANALDDVEAHGLRERAAVFAVVAVGVLGAGAGVAGAMPAGSPEGAPSPQASAMVTDASSAAGYAAAPAEPGATLTDVSSGGGYVAAATDSGAGSTLTDASSGSGYVAAATDSGAGSTLTDASSGSGYQAAAASSEGGAMLTDASSGSGYSAAAAASDAGTRLTDVSSGSGYSAPAAEEASGGGSFDIQAPSPSDAALFGGAALAIAAAAFATRRTRPPARPA
jgi:hypothetical protein